MKKVNFLATIIGLCIFTLPTITSAQGCSDAGFCSVGNPFKATETNVNNYLEIGAVYGTGEKDVTILSPFLTYTRSFSDKFALSTKLTYNSANGNLGTNSNFGDIFLTGNYKFNPNAINKAKWSSLLGIKMPLTDANDKNNNSALPMPYQASLGTFDVIAGVNLEIKSFEFNTAFQIPLTQNNENTYFNNNTLNSSFVSTNQFKRQPDALFRTTYKIQTNNKKFTFKPNVLFIYHLANDTYKNEANKEVEIEKSTGLTINGNLIANMKIGKNSSLETSLATPFLVREVRPDGLTRSFTIGLSFKQGF